MPEMQNGPTAIGSQTRSVSLMGLAAQATGIDLPSQVLSSLPYIITIIVLGIISADKRLLKLNGIASLGEPFER